MKNEVKDAQLKEIIDYYIELSGLKSTRPNVNFNYGEIKEFNDGGIISKKKSTINAKVRICQGRLIFYATEKLKKLQTDDSLKAKRCMHQLIAHEVGHLYYCDNVVDYDLLEQNNYMRILSTMRELRADIFGAYLIKNGKYANELNLNSELAIEQAFYFVPTNLNDKNWGYPNKQSRIYYACTYGILGSGVTRQAIIDIIIRYCIAYKKNVKDFKEKLESKIKRVTVHGKKSWYSCWVECAYLAEHYLENMK